MTIKYHTEFDQGSGAWLKARKGIVTASAFSKLLTPTLKVANNDKTRAHFYQILCDRITPHLEENFESWDMKRGKEDEIFARELYSETYHNVEECGFVTNDEHGDFTLGYSPDGLVGNDGLIEVKSRLNAIQVRAVMEDLIEWRVPKDDVLQVQAALLVTGRKWCDYIVYSRGLPMVKVRAEPIPEIHTAMIDVVTDVESRLKDQIGKYKEFISQFPATEYIPFSQGIGV